MSRTQIEEVTLVEEVEAEVQELPSYPVSEGSFRLSPNGVELDVRIDPEHLNIGRIVLRVAIPIVAALTYLCFVGEDNG